MRWFGTQLIHFYELSEKHTKLFFYYVYSKENFGQFARESLKEEDLHFRNVSCIYNSDMMNIS